MVKKLTQLVFDTKNRLVDKKGQIVEATPLGVPVGIVVPIPISDCPVSPNYFNVERIVKHVKRFHSVQTGGILHPGDVREADAYVFSLTGHQVFSAERPLYRNECGYGSRTTCRAGALQFYRKK